MVRRFWPAWAALATGLGLVLALNDWPRFAVASVSGWVLGVHAVLGLGALLLGVGALRRRPGFAVVALAGGAGVLVLAWLGRDGSVPLAAWAHSALGAALLAWLGPVAPGRRSAAAIVVAAIVAAVLWRPAAAPPESARAGMQRVRAGGPVEPLDARAAGCVSCHEPVTGAVHDAHGPQVACSACHRGEPRSTNAAVAHGQHPRVRRPPLLTGVFAQATCIGCHMPYGAPSGDDAWRRGRDLWGEGGCAGCHEAAEGRLGPNLKLLAWAWAQSPLSVTGAVWVAAGWPAHAAFLGEAIREPLSHVPRGLPAEAQPAHMPAYGYDDAQIRDLVVYLIAQADWGYPVALSGPSPRPVELAPTGAALYADPEIGCALCHRLRGSGGELGPPLDAWQGRDPAELAALIADPNRARVPGYPPLMPLDYGTRLSAEQLALLAAYITGHAP